MCEHNHMAVMTSTEARKNFGQFLDMGSRKAVVIKRQNREIGAFIPMEDYKKLRALRLKELNDAAEKLSEQAKANGLTEDILAEILNEVNPS